MKRRKNSLKLKGKKITPLLLIAILTVSAIGIGAVSRFLFTAPINIDITYKTNPYEVAIINATSLEVATEISFTGDAYEEDLVKTIMLEANNYLVSVVNEHTMTVWAYIEVEGLTSGTFEVLMRPIGETEYVVVDTFNSTHTTATYGFEFDPTASTRLVKFRIESEDLETMTLGLKVYGEDSLRVP